MSRTWFNGMLSIAALGLMLAAQAGHAGSLQISPVTVNLSAATVATTLTLRNPGATPLYGQIRVFRWDQRTDSDELLPSEELIASPPIIQIAPQSEQLVRLIRRNAGPSPTEQSYRLLIDELPAPDASAVPGVNIRLRYSVPVFVDPANARAQPQLTWSVRQQDGEWYLGVRNAGDKHAQVAATTVTTQSGQSFTISKGLLGYTLAGREREWKMNVPTAWMPGATLAIQAVVNTVTVNTDVAVTKAVAQATAQAVAQAR